jgi:hypothetical protein
VEKPQKDNIKIRKDTGDKMGFTKKSRIFIFAILVIVAGLVPATAEEFDEIIDDSDAAVEDAEEKIDESKGEIDEYDETGELPDESSDEGYSEEAGSPSSEGGPSPLIYDNGKEKFANINTTFALGSQDNLSSVGYVEYKIDDDQFQKYTQPVKFTTGGAHIITYRAIDAVGNKEQDKIFKIIIDDSPPDVSILPSAKLYTNTFKQYASPSYTYELKAADKLSGVQKIQFSLDGGGYQDYSTPIQVDANGKHHLKFIAIDNVGNVSAEGNFTWFVDSVKPKVKIKNSPSKIKQIDGKLMTNNKTLFILKSKDKGSGVGQTLFSIDGGNWQQYTSPMTFTQEKEYTLNVKSIDNVGNVSDEVNIQFQIDNNPPVTTLSPVTQ